MNPYLPTPLPARREMLKELGLREVEELFSDIPPSCRSGPPELPARSEEEVMRFFREILSENMTLRCFAGGGVWPHHSPPHVRYLLGLPGFRTSYTPYQPEINQGLLQAIFEYQSLMAELLGLEVVNASMYDWATALGEAALMCSRLTGRKRFLVPQWMGPERYSVLLNYAKGPAIEVVKIPHHRETGCLDLGQLEQELKGEEAGVYLENPSYLGVLETQVEEIAEMVHRHGALFVVGVNPISLGLLRAPGDYGADIVVGEGQPLGLPMAFGGFSLGIFACRKELVRQMPGRLVGLTKTLEGGRAFCLVLQTREQHIRRERATSNICTNETLCAIGAAIYLASLGAAGLRKVAERCVLNARYLMGELRKIGFPPLFEAPHFNEFAVRCPVPAEELNRRLLRFGVLGGKPLRRHFPELGDSALVCATELHSKEDLDGFVRALKECAA
ncbi:MAG: aminomethyl-transferring glycine dehydrogenase subunit GcvPA [Candidatus Hadarchaeales archaeon]